MNNLNFSQNSPSFTARSPQIKDAQWVARTVRSIPHVSSTRVSAPMWGLQEKYSDLYIRFLNKKPYEHFVARDEQEMKIVKLFAWQKRLIKKLVKAREEWRVGVKDDYRRVTNVLGQFKYDKIGNCGEDAFLSASIVKMNGVKNVYTARMNIDDAQVDHVVCVFNPDGSKFDGKVKKDTIIIDSWINEADFASNMFVKYKNLCKKFFFNLKPQSKISFRDIKPIELSGSEQLLLSMKYEKLHYPSSTREFMQKK